LNKIKTTLVPTFVLVLLVLTTTVYADDVSYSLTINYKEGKISLVDLKLREGTAPSRLVQPEEGYTLKVISFNNEVLHSFKFVIELIPQHALKPEWFDENGTQIYFPNVTFPVTNETSIVLTFPYFRNAKTVEIYSPNKILVLSVDVSNYATCNMNTICDPNENYQVCPEDCKQGTSNFIVYGIVSIVFISLISLVLFKIKKRKK